LTRFCTATAVSGVSGDGFQTTGSPQTAASIAFHAQDRDREVEGGDHSDRTERMPLFHHPVHRPFAGDGQAVKLPGEATAKSAMSIIS